MDWYKVRVFIFFYIKSLGGSGVVFILQREVGGGGVEFIWSCFGDRVYVYIIKVEM